MWKDPQLDINKKFAELEERKYKNARYIDIEEAYLVEDYDEYEREDLYGLMEYIYDKK